VVALRIEGVDEFFSVGRQVQLVTGEFGRDAVELGLQVQRQCFLPSLFISTALSSTRMIFTLADSPRCGQPISSASWMSVSGEK